MYAGEPSMQRTCFSVGKSCLYDSSGHHSMLRRGAGKSRRLDDQIGCYCRVLLLKGGSGGGAY